MTEQYSVNYMNYCKKNMIDHDTQFIKWIDQIEKIIKQKTDLQLLDLPDEPYMELYENCTEPSDVVEIILNELSLGFTF